jgi:transposase
MVVPPLPKEVQEKLAKYCPLPTQNNLATQYYFWNLELQKENQELKNKVKRLEKENKDLKRRIEELKKKIEELIEEKEKFLRMLFKRKRIISKNSTKTTRSFYPRTKESYVRPLCQRIDEEKEAILKLCPHCQTKLSKKVATYQRIVEDIPDFEKERVKVTKYTINRYWCSKCQKIITAKPLEVLPKCRLGINTLLYVLYSKYRLRLTQDLIKENLNTYFNLKISEGEINNLLNKGKEIFKPKWREIIEKIRASPVINSDETGWKINGENCWLWDFVGDKAVRYTISESRGKGIPEKVLGKDFKGAIISDFYQAYNQFKEKQRCWIHLLRKAKELLELRKINSNQKEKIENIYQKIVTLKKESIAKEKIEKEATLIERKLLKISQAKSKDKKVQNLYHLIKKHLKELTLCLRNPLVPADNNRAERMLRPLVILRKISQGNKSKKGALTQEINLSVIETLKLEGKELFPAMRQLATNYILNFK